MKHNTIPHVVQSLKMWFEKEDEMQHWLTVRDEHPHIDTSDDTVGTESETDVPECVGYS